MRIVSANLNGIRSARDKGFFEWLIASGADVCCVQEIKAQETDIGDDLRRPTGYQSVFHAAEKRGYSGVGIYSRRGPDRVVSGLGIADIDAEGRYLQADFDNLSIVSIYLPSGSSSPERQLAKFSFMERFWPMLETLARSGREVILCGDWNIAHREIDLKNWKGNLKNSGFLPEERGWLSGVFDELGWVDVYRHLYPDAGDTAYTWWSNRGQAYAKNVGWRIDYQIATPGVAATARVGAVYKDRKFSDHAPLVIDYDGGLA